MTEWNIEKLTLLLSRCGAVAMEYYKSPPMELKDDKSVVTAADKAIERILGDVLDNPAEGSYMIGEETIREKDEEYIQSAFKTRCWIVDPIDGTAPYTGHIPVWGISVAMAENGIIKEGAIYFPALNELMISSNGEALFAENFTPGTETIPTFTPYPFKKRKFDGTSLLCISQLTGKQGKVDLSNTVIAWSTCVGSFAWVLKGLFGAYIGTLKLWDVAASIVFMQIGGFKCRLNSGIMLDENFAENGCFKLDKNSTDRWKLNGYFVLAPDMATIETVDAATTL